MTLLLNMVKNSFRKWFALGMILLVAGTFSAAFAQDDPAAVEPVQQPVTGTNPSSGTLSSGPWGGTRSGGSTRGTTAGTSSGGGLLARPGTVLDDPPGGPGNPDVPFDSNMNIAFLVVGLVFSFVVYKKKFSVKSEPVNK